jgi:DNA-binding NtrC family response regulator
LVDDDINLLNLFKEAVNINGHENVFTFTEPKQALNYIQKKSNDFELVISDYKMPSMNGCELCTQ